MNQRKITLFDYQEHIYFNWPSGIKYKVVRKGRRAGLTRGMAHCIIEDLQNKQGPILWVDTNQGNLTKYFDRYFKPLLKKNNIAFDWSIQSKQLLIGDQYCDFRSEEQGDAIEGFGYRKIILNEAGIILKNRELYTDSILPMLLDYPDSKLIAGGVPKGKKTKDGKDHLFYDLWKRCETNQELYKGYHITAHDNPVIKDEDIKALEVEMFATGGQIKVNQEVYGEFVDKISTSPFLIHFDKSKHVGKTRLDLNKQLFLSVDFNLRPFCCRAAHIWEDSRGHHYHTVDELKIENGSIPAMIKEMRTRYYPWLPTVQITGDHGGKKGELSMSDNASYFIQIYRGLGIKESQINVPANPQHETSSGDCNYVYFHHPDIMIGDHLINCVFDAENVEVGPDGTIKKASRNKDEQQSDFMDTDRYMINTFIKPTWLRMHQKSFRG